MDGLFVQNPRMHGPAKQCRKDFDVTAGRQETFKKMQILYSHRVQSHDGQSVHIEELVTAFRDGGHEITVVGPSFYEKANFGGESSVVHIVRRVLPAAL